MKNQTEEELTCTCRRNMSSWNGSSEERSAVKVKPTKCPLCPYPIYPGDRETMDTIVGNVHQTCAMKIGFGMLEKAKLPRPGERSKAGLKKYLQSQAKSLIQNDENGKNEKALSALQEFANFFRIDPRWSNIFPAAGTTVSVDGHIPPSGKTFTGVPTPQ